MDQSHNMQFSEFADTIRLHKYSHDTPEGKETWRQTSERVAKNVLKAVNGSKTLVSSITELIDKRMFLPGGRYLYAAGRPYHQVQNCFHGSTKIVTRSGVKPIKDLVGTNQILMTSEGRWVEAPINSFGIQKIFKLTIKRYGQLKDIFVTKDHTWLVSKNISKDNRCQTKIKTDTINLKLGDKLWHVFGYGISRTPMSVDGIRHGIVFGDGHASKDEFGFSTANLRLCGDKVKDLSQWFKCDKQKPIGVTDIEISILPNHYKKLPDINLDRSYLLGWLAGYISTDGCVSKEGTTTLTSSKKENLEFVKNICYVLGIGTLSIHGGERISPFDGTPCYLYSLQFVLQTLNADLFLREQHRENFIDNISVKNISFWEVVSVEDTGSYSEVYCATVPETHEFVLEDNILTGNCLLLRAQDSREGWSDLLQKSSMALMTGAGIGIDYSNVRPEGSPIRKTGGLATGPLALMQMLNECGRGIMQGGSRRSAIWAGLKWSHPDIHKFIGYKNWIPEVRKLKESNFNFPATMDGTNISVQLDDEFFAAFHNDKHKKYAMAQQVYWAVIRQMLKTGEPGFSVDIGDCSKETLRNACTEVTSEDDSDICNLGSINLARINSIDDMKMVTEVATAFLVAGTVYSDVPYSKVDQIRTKNRRLGLGVMGVHEWLLRHGKKYGEDEELKQYMDIYAGSTAYAHQYCNKWNLSKSVKTRAIAPTGTIGILAETTTGCEPIFCAAYKRRYLKGSTWNYQYVIDPTAKILVENGMNPDHVEDAYSITPDRRVAFQVWLQQFVDHGISSTINLPSWGSEFNNENTVQAFGQMLIKHLPNLRGITCYPDGARGGQPLNTVSYQTATKHVGQTFVEAADICDITKGGSCGS